MLIYLKASEWLDSEISKFPGRFKRFLLADEPFWNSQTAEEQYQ